jgi:hypothetical protein
MSGKLQIRRGLKSQLPTLSSGELGLATDTNEVYVGNGNNVKILTPLPTLATWIAPTLLNSWINFGGAYNTVGYYKDDFGIVHIRGLIKSGVVNAGTPLFTLPAGYRPIEQCSIATLSNTTTAVPCVIEISVTGSVQIGAFPAGDTWLALDGIHFRAEQ